MRSTAAAAVAAALILTAGCDRNATDPARAAHLLLSPPTFDVQSADAMQDVTGHYEFVGINTGNDFKYSLSAIRHRNGDVSGEVEERTTVAATGDLVRDMHGTVTCFVISGNTAFIAGIVDRVFTTVPAQADLRPGAGFRLVVVDNGNGENDPPDMGSNARFGVPSTSDAFCAHPAPFNLEPIEHGNVVIHP